MVPVIHGTVAPGFEPVRAAFAENFQRRREIGASCCVRYRGQVVVDLWAGIADTEESTPWQKDTRALVFSATKGVSAAAVLMLADRGLLDYDKPVAFYWPEFGAQGKDAITVRMLLNHRSGLSAIDAPLTLEDLEYPERLASAAAAQKPMWEPGKAQGYCAVSYGVYVGALFRKVTGISVGRFIREEIAQPLGISLSVGEVEGTTEPLATIYPPTLGDRVFRMAPRFIAGNTVEGRFYRAALSRGSATQRAFSNPRELGAKGIHNYNDPRVHRMELPWCNAITNARGLATLYGALLGGERWLEPTLVTPATLKTLYGRQSWSTYDRVLHKPLGFSQGFIKEEGHLFSPNPESFGHPGAGGALGFADPVAGFAIGYVQNRMDFRIRSPRALALCHALYACAPPD